MGALRSVPRPSKPKRRHEWLRFAPDVQDTLSLSTTTRWHPRRGDDEGQRFPQGAIALHRDTYVDDIVTGASTIVEAAKVQQELRGLCMAGGFLLRKWTANNLGILAGVPQEHRLALSPHSWSLEGHATLGLHWHPAKDHFIFSVQTSQCSTFSNSRRKRCVLSETARLFNPLGWLTPVTMRAKILIQSVWLKGLDWDAPFPSADTSSWRNLRTSALKQNQSPSLARQR